MASLFSGSTSTTFLYILYGTSLFLLGVSIAVKEKKGSDLKIAGSLWMLGTFGLLQGAHEWAELGLMVEGAHMSSRQILAVKSVTALLVLVSCALLLQFGISLIRAIDGKRGWWASMLPFPLLFIWGFLLWHSGSSEGGLRFDFPLLRQAEIGARYTIGIGGALTTAYALIAYSRKVTPLSPPVSRKLFYAGIAFVLYALFAGVFSVRFLISYVPFPMKLLRTFSALGIMYFIVSALTLFDIEMRRKIERQMKRVAEVDALSSLGQLAAGVAHEINNPLAKASLGVQRLKSGKECADDELPIREQLEAIERSIDRASLIAREFLQLSGGGQPDFVPCDVSLAVKNALGILQYRLGNVKVSESCRRVPLISGDPRKLEQAFVNILSNAVAAMPAGGDLTVTTAEGNKTVIVTVSDTGAGAAPEDSRVFDPLFATKGADAAGPGLSIAYMIVRRHQGTIDVSSEPGKGTTVVVSLPVKARRGNA